MMENVKTEEDTRKAVVTLQPLGRTEDASTTHVVYSEYTEELPTAQVVVSTGTDSAAKPSENTTVIVVDNLNTPELYAACLTLGWLGIHQFFLGRRKWGLLYLCTVGCLGVGIAVDLFRIPLLQAARKKTIASRGSNDRFVETEIYEVRLSDAYALWIFGFLGAHQFYLGRNRVGMVYACTFGLFGVGWALDLLRLPVLARKDCPKTSLFEFYLFLIPGGLFGLHYLYIGRYARFVLALCTLNFLGLGFVVDLFRAPLIYQQAVRSKGDAPLLPN